MHLEIRKFLCLIVLAGVASFLAVGADAQTTNASQRRKANRQRRVQAAIQETYSHKFEVGLGGGYIRFRPGSTMRHVDQGGWQASGARYFSERLGLVADFHGYYGTVGINPNQFGIYSRGIHEYTYEAGPTYRFYAQQKFAVSGRVLFGVATGNFSANTNGIPPQLLGMYPDGATYASNVGIPLEYNIDPALAIRLTPELLTTHFGSEWQFNKGFTLGLIYRFGQQ